MAGWVDVTKVMPKPYVRVKVKTEYGAIGEAYHALRWVTDSKSGVRLNFYADGKVTHWAPISIDQEAL